MQIYENFTTKFNTYKNLEEKLMNMNERFLNKIRVNDYDPQKFMKNPNIEETFENRKFSVTQYKKSMYARCSSKTNLEIKDQSIPKEVINSLNNNNKDKTLNDRIMHDHQRLNQISHEDYHHINNQNTNKFDMNNLFDNNQRINQKVDLPFDFHDSNKNISNYRNNNNNNILNNQFQSICHAFANDSNNQINAASFNKRNTAMMSYNYPPNVSNFGNNCNANINLSSNKTMKENVINNPNYNEGCNSYNNNVFDFDFTKPIDNNVISNSNYKRSNTTYINKYNFKIGKVNEFTEYSNPQKSLSNEIDYTNNNNNKHYNKNNNVNQNLNINKNNLFVNNSNFENARNNNLNENNTSYSMASHNEANGLHKNTNAAGDSVFIDYNTVRLNRNLNNTVENSNLKNNALDVNSAKSNYPSLDSVLDDSSIVEFPPVNSHRIVQNRAFFEPIEEMRLNNNNRKINNTNIIPNNSPKMQSNSKSKKIPIMLSSDNRGKNEMQISPAKKRIMQQSGSQGDLEKILNRTDSAKVDIAKDPFEGFY